MLLCKRQCKITCHCTRVNFSFCIYYGLLFFYKMHAFAHLRDMSYNIHNEQEKSIANSHFLAHLNNMPDLRLVSKHKFATDRNHTTSIKRSICIEIQPTNLNSETYVDTITQDDRVRQQYALLPYPPVTESYIQRMKIYYDEDVRNIPFTISPGITLENINHFLYRGRNLFK